MQELAERDVEFIVQEAIIKKTGHVYNVQ
jgi:hypothetical protein